LKASRWVMIGVTVACLAGCSDYSAKRKAMAAVAAHSVEPSSVEFRNIEIYPNAICGQANGKDNTGSFRGFRDFSYDRNSGVASVDFTTPAPADSPPAGMKPLPSPECNRH
jgi:hypothetical protein